jgi:hypothetical protein
MKQSNLGQPINGKPHDIIVIDERQHFYTCPSCGQSVDMRDLSQVLWHEQPGHTPLEPDA